MSNNNFNWTEYLGRFAWGHEAEIKTICGITVALHNDLCRFAVRWEEASEARLIADALSEIAGTRRAVLVLIGDAPDHEVESLFASLRYPHEWVSWENSVLWHQIFADRFGNELDGLQKELALN